MYILKIYPEEKYLILLKTKSMMDIQEVLLQWFTSFQIKNQLKNYINQ